MAINTSPSFNPGGGMSFRVISQEDRSAAPAEAARVICQERITGGRSRMAIPASHAGRQGSPPGVTTIPEPQDRLALAQKRQYRAALAGGHLSLVRSGGK